MKKIVSLLLVFLMLAGSAAYAEGTDFSTMTTDELLALREELNTEINARIGDDNALIGDGVYVAGVDIKPGMYQITCAAAFDDREFYVNLFKTLEDYETYDASRFANAEYRFFQAALYEGGLCTTIEIYNGIDSLDILAQHYGVYRAELLELLVNTMWAQEQIKARETDPGRAG